MTDHLTLMKRALVLAHQGGRAVMPNPCVGAVLTHGGKVIGEGFHQIYGGPHAEVHAIQSVQDVSLLSQSTLYVTLEPCAHYGKTPPCADLIVASKIPRVVVGCRDPFVEVAGKGIQKLKDAGIHVHENIFHDGCVIANRRFILTHRERRPYIILKWAQTTDGFMAPTSRQPLWLTSEASKVLVHQWRAQEMAILVGTTTAANDNPSLTVRYALSDNHSPHPLQNPIRVVLDLNNRLQRDLSIFSGEAKTLLVSASRVEWPPGVEQAIVDPSLPLLPQLCEQLYQRKLSSLIVEGGAQTLRSFIENDLWDEARVFTAPTSLKEGIKAPELSFPPDFSRNSGNDGLRLHIHPSLCTRLGISNEARSLLTESVVEAL